MLPTGSSYAYLIYSVPRAGVPNNLNNARILIMDITMNIEFPPSLLFFPFLSFYFMHFMLVHKSPK